MNTEVNVLDHGYVRLVDHMGDDLSVVRAARVSYDAEWRAGEDQGSDARLINYLWKNRHTTPFESVTMTWEVKAPIFVLRQWHRHRTWSYNEVSARYTELPEDFYIPGVIDIGTKSTTNKQGRMKAEESQYGKYAQSLKAVREHHVEAFKLYKGLIDVGWPRELARTVLPVATYSRMFATVNLLNFLKFLTLRCDSHAQLEIRVYADAMRDIAYSVAPECMKAWENNR